MLHSMLHYAGRWTWFYSKLQKIIQPGKKTGFTGMGRNC